jgi:hypothetical protein
VEAKLNAQKPAIGGLFANSPGIQENIALDGWRFSDAQLNLQRNSLLTGNLTGNFAHLARERANSGARSAPLASNPGAIPCKNYQGNISSLTGNYPNRFQGICRHRKRWR